MGFKSIITISREYGSGGREIGRKVARKLNIPFYDKSVSELAAIATGFKPEVIDAFQDRTPTGFDYGSYSSGNFVPISDELFGTQVKIIKKLAEKPCIIIGRCSDYILRDNPNLVRIFIIANEEDRIKRISETYHVSEKETDSAIIINPMLIPRMEISFSHLHSLVIRKTKYLNLNLLRQDIMIQMQVDLMVRIK